MSTIEQLQRIVADETQPTEKRRQAAEHILKLQQKAEWAAIPDDDPEVISLMETAQEEYLQYWPEFKNRTLEEAKEISYLRRVTRDATRSSIERSQGETALMAIRRRLRGDK